MRLAPAGVMAVLAELHAAGWSGPHEQTPRQCAGAAAHTTSTLLGVLPSRTHLVTHGMCEGLWRGHMSRPSPSEGGLVAMAQHARTHTCAACMLEVRRQRRAVVRAAFVCG